MTDFMRNYIRLREVARRIELPAQLLIEREIDVDLLVVGTVERSNRSAGETTRRAYLIRKQHERWLAILPPVLPKLIVPNVLGFCQHHPHKLLQLFLFGVLRTRGLNLRRRRSRRRRLVQKLLRIDTKHEREDHEQQSSQPTTDRDAARRHTTPVLDVRALTFTSPTHSLSPPVSWKDSSVLCHANDP